jgi:xanthine/CO dehydrogenase XdhC/CoxF family maturation factor
MTETHTVFNAALDSANDGRPAVLATIVSARGSVPRGIGSRMLIDLERGLTGTVGGGCGEGQVIEAAKSVFESGEAQIVRVDLTEDLFSWSPAVCGGVFDVLIERI